MIEKVKSFLATHGFTIMISGFSISAAGILLYMYFTQPQHFNRLYSSIAFDATCTGIGFYVIGRIGVIIQRQKLRQEKRDGLRNSMQKDDA
ncbi:MAG: hypothetical protein MUF22_00550 [Chitinispirillaceae bacterium]|jgi:hypothetical protein|nr:hypothetical protein [Chitinispirillaceae bacterium]